jgi:VWFA-related protein
MKTLILLCIVLFTAALRYAAAMQEDPVRLHADTRVVQIDVIVTDSHSKPVTDLSKQDFTVTDNGKPRVIDIFSINRGEAEPAGPASMSSPSAPNTQSKLLPPNVFSNRNAGPPELPGHSTVIVLDQVNAFFEDAGYARQQVMNLMSKLKPDERIALYVIARKRGLVVVQDYTTDHELLIRSLEKYIPRGLMPRPWNWDVDVQDRSGQPAPPDATKPSPAEFEFAWRENSEGARLSLQALAEHLVLVPGRKSVYMVTQAFPARLMKGMGQPAWDKTLSALNDANVAVNTVDSRGLMICIGCKPHDPVNGTITAMQQIAEATGGTAYFGRNDLDTAMADGMAAARISYTLAFYLPDIERDNKFHALKVKADRAGLQLYYRQGYYAGDTDLPPDKNTKELEASLLNQVNADGIGITASIDRVPGTPRGTLNIRLNLDPGTLSRKQQTSRWIGKVEETFIEVNETGATLSKVSDTKEFEVTDANRTSFDSKGVTWPVSMPLLPGATKITVVVRDSNTGQVGSLAVPLH